MMELVDAEIADTLTVPQIEEKSEAYWQHVWKYTKEGIKKEIKAAKLKDHFKRVFVALFIDAWEIFQLKYMKTSRKPKVSGGRVWPPKNLRGALERLQAKTR